MRTCSKASRIARGWERSETLILYRSRTRGEIFPILSRVQNIGYEMGENNRTPKWYQGHHRTPSVAGMWVAGHVAAGSRWLLD